MRRVPRAVSLSAESPKYIPPPAPLLCLLLHTYTPTSTRGSTHLSVAIWARGALPVLLQPSAWGSCAGMAGLAQQPTWTEHRLAKRVKWRLACCVWSEYLFVQSNSQNLPAEILDIPEVASLSASIRKPPDHTDRSISKWQWEEKTSKWKRAVRAAANFLRCLESSRVGYPSQVYANVNFRKAMRQGPVVQCRAMARSRSCPF